MRSQRKPSGSRRAEKKKPKAAGPTRKFKSHPLFGEVPLVLHTYEDESGRIHSLYHWDLDYKPELPPDAVRGDARKQNLCFACHVPQYFYVDQHRVCIQCGKDFVFSAAEQKFWYETLKFYGTSVAIRCKECRRRKKTEASLGQQLQAVKKALKKDPKNPARLLELAETIVDLHLKTGHGKLDEAITAARAARLIDPNASESIFWEGCCHMIAGRNEKAIDMLQKFLALPARSKQHSVLAKKATEYLEQIGAC
jgi:hypothetical protein